MKLLMLCREPRLYSCQRLTEEAGARGCQMAILDPNRMLLHLTGSQSELYYQAGELHQRPRPEPLHLTDFSGVLPRFGTTSTAMGCNVLRHFEQQQIAVLNRADAVELARHKWQSLQRLAAAGLPVPDSNLAGELFGVNELVKLTGSPLIVKTLAGSQGVGVMLADTPIQATSLLETLRQHQIPHLQQRFIREASGQDLRALVIGERVVAAMQRVSQTGDFRANVHQGGRAETVELSATEQQLAIAATKALGLAVAGVDLIRSQQGTLILEVNASAGLEGIERATGVNIAALMIEHLLRQIREQKG